MKRVTTLCVLALLLTVGSVALAQDGPMGRGGFGGRGPGDSMSPFILRSLNLTPDQWTEVRKAVAAHRPTFETLWKQLRDARQNLAARLVDPRPAEATDADIQALVQRIGKAREQLGNEALQLTLDIRKVLTAEQIAKAGEVQAKLKDLRGQMRQLLRGE